MIGVGRGDHTAVTLATAEVEFRHEALLYAGSAAFLDGTLRFIGEGLSANEPMLVAVSPAKIESLRQNLGTDADRVCFANMHEIGANPARIIPVWRDFLEDDGSNGRRVRGIGEPIWDGRTSDELVECQRHEALLNVAFAGQPAWRLMCPYDTMTLPPDVIDEAQRSHPFIVEGRVERDSPYCRDLASMAAPFDVPLPAPSEFEELTFDADSLGVLRRLVSRRAMDAGLGMTRAGELAFSVHELAANSVRHGGGHGTLRLWEERDAVLCEVSDSGVLDEPLAGRRRPAREEPTGRGLWLVNQLCDLVQIRSFREGCVVRVHMHRDPATANR